MAKVRYVPDDITLDAEIGTKLIDLFQNNKISVQFGCENAECGICMSTIRSGMSILNSVSDKEKEILDIFGGKENDRLVCQCRVAKEGTVEIIEYSP